jgi:Deoxynucleotide monophosphate kinase
MDNCDCQSILETAEAVCNTSKYLNTDCNGLSGVSIFYVMAPFVIIYASLIYSIYRHVPKRRKDSNESSDDTPSSKTDAEFDPADLIVVGMTGRKRSGKDTSGERLVRDHGFVRVAFADALKEACISVFGFSNEQVYGDDLKEVVDEYWGYSPREVLQKVGTELFREAISRENVLPEIGKNIWVRTIERKILNLARQGHRRFVITDVRFPNELAFLTDSVFNAYSIKVVRQAVMDETDMSKLHASEAAIDGFECDFTIQNDKTIEDLNIAIDQIVRMTDKDALIASTFLEDDE